MDVWSRTKVTAICVTHDVDEAILLSDRVVMMTNGPNARIGRVMPVDIARPRTRRDLLDHPRYYDYRRELLDFLASELIRGGWKLKPVHRAIVLSRTYQQSAAHDPAKDRADPENRLFGRQPVRRLEAEVIRDSILAVGGLLDPTPFGPGSLSDSMTRRSVYFTMKRSRLIPALTVFDAPDGTVGVGERPSTTVAPQALHLMNNPQVRAAAKGLAKRALEAGDDTAAVARAYRLALGRAPTAAELTDATAFLRGATGPAREAAATDLCQVLFCLNEFLYAE